MDANTLLFLLSGIAAVGSLDPCDPANHTPRSERERIVKTPAPAYPLCDSLLIPQWYRFTAEGGDRMAVGPQKPDTCGTGYPIAIEDKNFKHPEPGNYVEVKTKVCATDDSGCVWSEDVNIRRCQDKAGGGQDFFIYYLKAVPLCDMAYCTDTDVQINCHKSGKVPDSNGTSCIDPAPLIKQVKLGQPIYKPGDEDFYIPCAFESNANSSPFAEAMAGVIFYFNGRPGITREEKVEAKESRLYGRDLNGFFPAEIRCTAFGFWKHRGIRKGGIRTRSTRGYPAEVKLYHKGKDLLQPIFMEEDDSDPQQVEVYSTIPITRASHKAPRKKPSVVTLGIRSSFTDVKNPLIPSDRQHQCLTKIEESDWDPKTLKAKAQQPIHFVTFKDEGNLPGVLQNELKFNVEKVAFNKKDSIWQDIKLPTIVIKTTQKTPKTCQSYPDPHVSNFNKQKYDIHDLGDFVQVGIDGLATVSVRHNRCPNYHSSWRPTCVCAVAVREHNEVIIINRCSKNKPTQIIMRNAADSNQVALSNIKISTTETSANEYEIVTRSGIYVTAKTRGDYGYILTTKIPEGYEKHAKGICSESTTQGARKHRIKDPHESPFQLHVSLNPMITSDALRNFSYCYCKDSVVECDQTGVKDPKQVRFTREVSPRWLKDKKVGRRRRSADDPKPPYSDDLLILEPDDFTDFNASESNLGSPVWPTPNKGITEAQARAECTRVFAMSPFAALQGKLRGSEPATFINNCVSDIQMTEAMDVVQVTSSALEDTIASELVILQPALELMQKNSSRNGTLESSRNATDNSTSELFIDAELGKLLTEIEDLDAMNIVPCSPECMIYGTCQNGTCLCKPGFVGEDCNINITAPPILKVAQDGGECDVAERPCSRTYFTGDKFYAGSGVACSYQLKQYNPRDNTYRKLSAVKLSANYTAIDEIICPLPHLKGAAYIVNVSVTMNGRLYSNSLSYTILDSTCVDCVNGRCSMMSDGCFINNKCYLEKEVNPDRNIYVCNPSNSKFSWSKVPAPPCGTQRPSPAAMKKSEQRFAAPSSWPWHAEILEGTQRLCSGALVHHSWVLTAAECVRGRSVTSLRVRVDEEYSVVSRVQRDDVILLKLNGKSSYASTCLPEEKSSTLGSECYVTGWISENEDCYNASDKGAKYRGFVDEIQRIGDGHDFCHTWNSVKGGVLPADGGVHAHCRNPPSTGSGPVHPKPWCYINLEGKSRSCDVPKCDARAVSQLQLIRVPLHADRLCSVLFRSSRKKPQVCAGGGREQRFKGELGSPLLCRARASDPLRLVGLRAASDHHWSERLPGLFNRITGLLQWIKATTA